MRFEGYHDTSKLPIKRGDMIVIPAGVSVKTMHPSRDTYVTKRAQTVKVHSVGCGQSIPNRAALLDRDYYEPLKARGFDFTELEAAREANSAEFYNGFVAFKNPTVTWAGAGGYWCDADLNDLLSAIEQKAAA